jgi:hypothetical protein
MINLLDYDILTKDDFYSMAYGSAVLVKNFDPTTFAPPAEGDVFLCTSGDITINDNVNRLDLGEDVNGIYFQYKELQVITGKAASTVSCTALNFSTEGLRRALGNADIDSTDSNKINTRLYYKPSDFENLALVFPKVGGGMVALVMNNSLSTGGLGITTTKNGKATMGLTFTAYRSIESKATPEIQYYSYDVTSDSDIEITAHPVSVVTEENTAVSFSVTATGATSYQWQVMAASDSVFHDISGETTDTLEIAAVDVTTSADGNRYRCVLSDSTSTVYSKPALLTVEDGA